MAEQVFLAVDLGASGGRVVAGLFDGERLNLEERRRFENGAVSAAGSLYWDALGLWNQVCEGLRAARAAYGDRVKTVGVDTWGVDFALLGRGDALLGNPHSYRDRRTEGMLDLAIQRIGREEIFDRTGLQFMTINTLYQLLAMSEGRSPLLEAAESLLLMPDFFHWLLTGVKANEFTNATTTQCYDPTSGDWARDMLDRLGVPSKIFLPIVQPGTLLGPLRGGVVDETGLTGVRVVAPGTHDTASAVMAVPCQTTQAGPPDWCYLSAGTWALMGVEVASPVISQECLRLNFTNEGGVGGTTRLLKNITGLWLVQECRRVWRQAGLEHSWEELNQLTAQAAPLAAIVDPDDAAFQGPGDMPAAIRAFCQKTGQPPPMDVGATIRCAVESVALKSRWVLDGLERLTGGRIVTIHMVGGGTQNRRLCQATADACQRRVVAGPIEATAIGNCLMQAIATGALGSIAEARQVVRRSFPLEEYLPRDAALWTDAYGRFQAILNR